MAELFAAAGAKDAVVDVQVELGAAVVDRITQRDGQAMFDNCDMTQANNVVLEVRVLLREAGEPDAVQDLVDDQVVEVRLRRIAPVGQLRDGPHNQPLQPGWRR